MINNFKIYEMSLQDILREQDGVKRNLLLDEFYSNLLSYNTQVIKREGILDDYLEVIPAIKKGEINFKEVSGYNDNLMSLTMEASEIEDRAYSEYSFEGCSIILYPSIETIKARKIHLCAFSGAKIQVGQEYSVYRLFVDNLTENQRYCLSDPIRMEVGYEGKVPFTVSELDDFDFKLAHSYDLDLEEHYNISVNYGHDRLPFRRLNKIKKKRM